MPEAFKSVLLFGAPGVGKGTQGKLLGQIPGMRHLATGDIFRGLDKHSELGRKVSGYMARGELVPDELTIQLWQEHMRGLMHSSPPAYRPERDLLILDGIPRSLNQAMAMDRHINVLLILHLTFTDMDDMVMRLKRRALQQGRLDDADEAVIRRRFDVYVQETRPVLSHYDPKLVGEVNAVGAPAEVLMHVLQTLVPVYKRSFGNPLE